MTAVLLLATEILAAVVFVTARRHLMADARSWRPTLPARHNAAAYATRWPARLQHRHRAP